MITVKTTGRDFRKEPLIFQDRKRVMQLYCRGKAYREICKLTDISTYMVLKIINAHINTRNANWVVTERQEKLVLKMYNAGYTGTKISTYFSVDEDVIYRILTRNKVEMRPPTSYRKYDLNEDFFEEINTENKAYWLGFVTADGAIGNERTLLTRLSDVDRGHLVKFQESLGSNYPYYYNKETNVSGFSVNSKKLTNDLRKLGVVENKTFKTVFLKHDDPDMVRHFIRGYYDGDGSISTSSKIGNKYANISICGNKNFLLQMQSFMIKELGLNKTKLVKQRSVFSLRYGGRVQALKILNWLYKDSTTYLDRKYQTYLELKESMKPN